MDRRAFLRHSAVASAAVGAMAGADAASETRKRMPCGVLGLGHAHALDVVEVLAASPDFELAGVCEPDESIRSRVEHVPALQGVPWLTRDALLGDGRVAMVAVESTVPRLLEYAHAVIDAGKHLHLDKPAGASLPDFETLLANADNRGRLVQMGYMFRYNPGFDLVRRAVREGWLGHVYSIHASMCTGLGGEKRASIAWHPGGIMFELGGHLTDMNCIRCSVPRRRSRRSCGTTARWRQPGRQPSDPRIRRGHGGDRDRGDGDQRVRHPAPSKSAAPAAPSFSSRSNRPRRTLCLSQAAGIQGRVAGPCRSKTSPRHVRDFDDLARCIQGRGPLCLLHATRSQRSEDTVAVSIPGSVV